jgi:hypothetical protein
MRGGKAITVELTLQIRRNSHASSPFRNNPKVAHIFAAINDFLNARGQLLFLSSVLAATVEEC